MIDYPPLEKDTLPVRARRALRNLLADAAAVFVVVMFLAWSLLR